MWLNSHFFYYINTLQTNVFDYTYNIDITIFLQYNLINNYSGGNMNNIYRINIPIVLTNLKFLIILSLIPLLT